MVVENTQVRGILSVIWQYICQPSQQSNGIINTSQERFIYLGSNYFALCGFPRVSRAGPPNSSQPTSLSYLHRFKIIPNSTCPRGLKEEKTINDIILNCTQLEKERRILRSAIVRSGETWPPLFEQITRKHIKPFTKSVRSIDFNTL